MKTQHRLLHSTCRIALSGVLALLSAAASFGADEAPPTNELAFQLGGFTALTRSDSQPRVDLSPGIALQANYGRLLASGRNLALYWEVHFLANPLREVASNSVTATNDVATLFVTPGVRLKFFPTARFSPYLSTGGGLAWFEQSKQQINGSPNPAARELLRGAFDVGGGVDVPVWRFLALRGEVRDFYTGTPNYNIAALRGGQNNIVLGGGFVVRWR